MLTTREMLTFSLLVGLQGHFTGAAVGIKVRIKYVPYNDDRKEVDECSAPEERVQTSYLLPIPICANFNCKFDNLSPRAQIDRIS